jgi:hypothetical protein
MDATLYCTARRGEWVVARHHGWRLLLSGLVHNFESCLTGQQSSGVQGRPQSSVQYGNYFIDIILFWLKMRWCVNGNQL